MNNNKLTRLSIWLCLTMFYCYQYVIRLIPSIMSDNITSSYNLSPTQFSFFASIYYIGYVIVHIPIGLLLNRFNNKIVMTFFVATTALGVFIMSYSTTWNFVLLGRFITGIGSSAAAVGILQILRLVYGAYFTRAIGLCVFCGIMTLVYSESIITQMLYQKGMVNSLQIIAYIGLALAIFFLLVMPQQHSKNDFGNIYDGITSVLLNKKILFLSLCAGLMVGPLEGFADAWGSIFLRKLYNIDQIVANDNIASILSGMAFGCVILPYIADKTNSHYKITIISGIFMFVAFILLMTKSTQQIKLMCYIIGLFSAYQVVIIPKISTLTSVEQTGIAASLANMIVMSFGSIFHKSIGTIFRITAQSEHMDNSDFMQYNENILLTSISIIPIAILVSVIALCIFYNINKKNRIITYEH